MGKHNPNIKRSSYNDIKNTYNVLTPSLGKTEGKWPESQVLMQHKLITVPQGKSGNAHFKTLLNIHTHYSVLLILNISTK